MNLLAEKIKNYIPFNEQEEKDKEVLLKSLLHEDILTRNNPFMHFSASSWVLNKQHTKVLMIYHKIYDSWSWMGGHADGIADLCSVACKELEEESGLSKYHLVSDQPFSLEVLTVDGHIKKGSYVSSHLHLNLTFLFEADEDDSLTENIEETEGVKWIPIEDIEKEVSEVWFMEHIYKKLIEKIKK